MPFYLPVTVAQAGLRFVRQYYHVLQHQPDIVHQFYGDGSTMVRIDGYTRVAASSMLQIHTLVMSLNYSGVEIKTTHSVESWNGGVLLMVSGSVHVKDLSVRRKFVQTFFLAPQQKGFFVLNDVFHFIDDEPIHQHFMAYVTQSNLQSKLNASNALREQVSNYILGGEVQASEFVAPYGIKENGAVDNYSFREQLIQQVPEAEKLFKDNLAVQSNGWLQSTMNPVQEHLSSPVEEPVGEPQKHTYASILQVAIGQSPPLVHSQPSFNRSNAPASERHHVPEPPSQQSFASSVAVEMSGAENADDFSAKDDEGEVKSVYVRNLSPTVSASEIEEEFEKFGKLTSEGVAIRSRKDIGVCYAFVEFRDISGVQNAIKAATVQVAGHQVFIEERRPNRNNSLRGGRRGRGRGSYLTDAPRGRFGGWSFGNGGDRDYYRPRGSDYYRPRGNGFYRPSSRQERGFSSN